MREKRRGKSVNSREHDIYVRETYILRDTILSRASVQHCEKKLDCFNPTILIDGRPYEGVNLPRDRFGRGYKSAIRCCRYLVDGTNRRLESKSYFRNRPRSDIFGRRFSFLASRAILAIIV